MATVESGLLSPAPSVDADTNTFANFMSTPRSRPLNKESSKYHTLFTYMEEQVELINARYAKSFAADAYDQGPKRGYLSFDKLVSDLNSAAEVLWVSNTPSIQVPFLLALAGLFQSTIHSFDWRPIPSLQMVAKFDAFFAYLLTQATNSSDTLIRNTEKARINSLVSVFLQTCQRAS